MADAVLRASQRATPTHALLTVHSENPAKNIYGEHWGYQEEPWLGKPKDANKVFMAKRLDQ
jgi:hypothetical protein